MIAELSHGDTPMCLRDDLAFWWRHWPRHGPQTHKYDKGATLVVAGGLTGVGASRLAARAALRIGAGLVTVACRMEALAAHASRGPDALMQRPIGTADDLSALLADDRLGSVVIGPALGLDVLAEAELDAVLECTRPAVLDADALTLLAHRVGTLAASVDRRGAPVVLTPHEGEFKRLFCASAAFDLGAHKIERARQAASLTGCIVVLKGAETAIARPDGTAVTNSSGSPALATAGSGDVLGGMIAGLMAQRMPAFEAACAAVWLHGMLGETLGRGLIADDLPEALVPLLKKVLADRS